MILIFTTLMIKARSAAPKLSPCQPKNCGNGPNISYPFWIPQQQESSCGSPQFNITCSDNNPILKISGDDYIIEDINYANNSILLANAEVFDEENSCPTPLHNFSLSGIPFSYGPTFAELYFFYNCTFVDKFATYSIDCASNDSHHSFAIFHTELLKKENYSIEWCQAVVNAAVSASDISKLLKMSYMDVLRKGFVLEWNGDDCRKCEKSGGKCGSLNNEFICVCNDQPRLGTCGKFNKT